MDATAAGQFNRAAVVAGALLLLVASNAVAQMKPATYSQQLLAVAKQPTQPLAPSDLMQQTDDDAMRKSWGCIQCHQGVHDMHAKETVKLGCIDCHGGNADCLEKKGAHVAPRFADLWPTAANPVRSYTLLNKESPEFIRFINPGDLRVAHISCGSCHPQEVLQVKKSMMTNGCMLWGAALYNNGAVPHKATRYGESYSMHGTPQRIQNVWKPEEVPQIARDLREKAMVPFLDPLPRFEISQPGNILRIFEQGGRFRPETGIPELGEEPGRPRTKVGTRGFGTDNRTDPVFIGLQKTRLLDPTLNFLGTNDHPGDYRSSGCSACHVVYANDRSPVHSGPFARFGNLAMAAAEPDPPGPAQFVKSVDPTISKVERAHPIAHRFTTAVPTSQCIVCHIHPGTNVLNTYLGFMWWDNESDGGLMYPRVQKDPTAEELAQSQMSNPDETAARGNWSDPNFLERVPELNQIARHNQFADFHGHGWVFRAVFKKDRQGNKLDKNGKVLGEVTTEQLKAAVVQPGEQYQPPPPPSNAQTIWPDPTRKQTLASSKNCPDSPVHLMDIHQERGMHCIDCHFTQDVHGNTKLYGEVRAAIEITCIDCHGTAGTSVIDSVQELQGWRQAGAPPRHPNARVGMRTTGPAADPVSAQNPLGGRDLLAMRTPDGKPRFEVRVVTRPDGSREPALIQRAMVEQGREWEVKQTADTINPKRYHYNRKSHMAKTVRWEQGNDRMTWGGQLKDVLTDYTRKDNVDGTPCAHQSGSMSCMTCHSSWNPSCFGCHLPQKANKKTPALHNEGDISRNQVAYNFQTLRDDVFMIARDGLATGNKINPARSSCAIHVTSYNGNRETIYHQQQTISGSGMSGIAFSTNVPHTVRGAHHDWEKTIGPGMSETKMCSDCHVSNKNDNNAIMAQLLMHGTNYTNFMGRYCWVAAGEHGFEAAIVTEQHEPQAVIGSTLHEVAFPKHFEEHVAGGRELEHAHEHPGLDILDQIKLPLRKAEILQVQPRGEYLYAACGPDGFRAFDIAFIDDKAFSERITSSPVSPLGQRLHVPTKYATAIAAPTTLAPDPTRVQPPENHEQAIHPLYGYVYVTDKYEGLILVGAGTLLDGNPLNNFLQREVTFNPNGILCGARSITIAGHYAYICCDAGLVVVSLEDPKKPAVTSVIGHEVLEHPVAVQVQFRYAFVCDEHKGLHVFDVTDLHSPKHVILLHMEECHNVYVARTYAYVAAGEHGLQIVDVTNPEVPVIDQVFDAGGCINDLHDVKLGITYTSEFAYLADGKNGLRVVQLTSPDTPGNAGFSPRPTPQLVATYKLPKGGHAHSIGEALDRDRAVDENGSQIAVFGRVGARPLNFEEQFRMFRRTAAQHPAKAGQVWKVSDDPLDESIYDFPGYLKDMHRRAEMLGPWPLRR